MQNFLSLQGSIAMAESGKLAVTRSKFYRLISYQLILQAKWPIVR